MEYFSQAIALINSNVEIAPFVIFGLLLLAGFNIPVSEDLMLFTSALLAAKNPDYLVPLFLAVFLGAYFSDLICYGFLGRFLGPKLFKIKFFASIVSQERLKQINYFFNKYGVLTLILGRFIPFGVRNALFISAGLGKMGPKKFALSDLVACTISCLTYFTIYYKYGALAVKYVKQSNYIIGAIAALVAVFFLVKKLKNKSN